MLTPTPWVSSGQDQAWREVTGQNSEESETSWKSLGGGGARVEKQHPELRISPLGFTARAADPGLHPRPEEAEMHRGSYEGTAGPQTEGRESQCSDHEEETGTKQRWRGGNQATHTVWFIGSSYTHTRYVHKHKYSNVHIYTGLADRPQSQRHPPPWALAGST